MTARDLVFTILWRTLSARHDVLHLTWVAAALAIALPLALAALRVRRHATRRVSEQPLQWTVEQQTARAVIAERDRIAREMQDVVAHRLAVVITLSDGASVTIRKDPEIASEAMGLAATTGRQALSELRRIVGKLRDDGDRPLSTRK